MVNAIAYFGDDRFDLVEQLAALWVWPPIGNKPRGHM
jgi:hypothetical protein